MPPYIDRKKIDTEELFYFRLEEFKAQIYRLLMDLSFTRAVNDVFKVLFFWLANYEILAGIKYVCFNSKTFYCL